MAAIADMKSEAHSDKRDGIAELQSATWACSYVFHSTSQSAHCQRAFSTSSPAHLRDRARSRGFRLTNNATLVLVAIWQKISNPCKVASTGEDPKRV